jgi:hypothetical protein
MTGRRITIRRGYRLDKVTGKLLPSTRHLDVSAKLRQAASRKIKPIRRTAPR